MIINRAMVVEVFRTSGAVTMVIFSIFLVTRVLGYLQQAARGDLPIESVLVLLGLKLVSSFDVILPLMLYIAILMVMGRWSRDNEMAVLSACGISLFNFLKPLFVLILMMTSIVATFSFYLTPKAEMVGWTLKAEYSKRDEISGVVPGVFMETRSGRGIYFVEGYDDEADRYKNVFVYKSSFGKEGVVVSKYAFQRIDELTGDKFLVLTNGTRYEGRPGSPNYRIVDFETYALRIEPEAAPPVIAPVKARPTTVIAKDSHPALVSEFHWRIAKVLVVPALGLFALTFSFVLPRQNRVPGMIMAFLIYFLYTNLLGFGVALISRGRLSGDVGLWGIHLAFLLISVVLFYRRARNLPLLPIPSVSLMARRFRTER